MYMRIGGSHIRMKPSVVTQLDWCNAQPSPVVHTLLYTDTAPNTMRVRYTLYDVQYLIPSVQTFRETSAGAGDHKILQQTTWNDRRLLVDLEAICSI